MDQGRFGEFEVSNTLLNNIPALRERLLEQGYLFFRGVLDKASLLEVRSDMLKLADKYFLVKKENPLLDGIFNDRQRGPLSELARKFETSRLYREILELKSFNAFGQTPVLALLYSGLLNGETLEHRRRIGRITLPQSFAQTTPPHQDYFYIRGTTDTYTNWIPTSDCPCELGGLAVLEGSNKLGFQPHVKMSGTGGNGIPHEQCEALGLRWLTTDFQLGDLLLFHSLTIHKALHNITEDRLRVSLEYRIQRKGDNVDPSSLTYHMHGAFGENETLAAKC